MVFEGGTLSLLSRKNEGDVLVQQNSVLLIRFAALFMETGPTIRCVSMAITYLHFYEPSSRHGK
jgi:hypothetical protein